MFIAELLHTFFLCFYSVCVDKYLIFTMASIQEITFNKATEPKLECALMIKVLLIDKENKKKKMIRGIVKKNV